MRRSSTLNFVCGATVAAALAAVALILGLRGASSSTSGWAIGGFAAMAMPVIATGAWLAHEQGRTGVTFVAVLGAGLLVRATLLVVVVMGAIQQGATALVGTLAGLAVGFVPVTAFELAWFARRAHATRARAEWPG